jgi:hypothetical protein
VKDRSIVSRDEDVYDIVTVSLIPDIVSRDEDVYDIATVSLIPEIS